MSFEKYGNKLINLLSKIEHKLDPTDAQIGGAKTTVDENIYFTELSSSSNHVSMLVHLEKDENTANSIEMGKSEGESKGYSVEQQLRLGCDDEGNMYKYSVVLTLHPKNRIEKSKESVTTTVTETGDAKTAIKELADALGKLTKQ